MPPTGPSRSHLPAARAVYPEPVDASTCADRLHNQVIRSHELSTPDATKSSMELTRKRVQQSVSGGSVTQLGVRSCIVVNLSCSASVYTIQDKTFLQFSDSWKQCPGMEWWGGVDNIGLEVFWPVSS
jgi:hypothetical protein